MTLFRIVEHAEYLPPVFAIVNPQTGNVMDTSYSQMLAFQQGQILGNSIMNFIGSVLDALGDEIGLNQHVSDITLRSKYMQMGMVEDVDVIEIELREHCKHLSLVMVLFS